MKVLVIGGYGYTGSALVSYLTSQLINAVAVGRRTEDYNKLSPDYLNSFDRIVLLAGHSSVPMCLGPLKSPWLNNIVNFKDLLHKVEPSIPIIYASSSSVYSNSGSKLSKEDEISLEYVNNYDLTKTMLDLFAFKESMSNQRCLIGLRFGTVNGASEIIRKELMINSMVYNAMTQGSVIVTNKQVHRPLLGMQDLVRGIHAVICTSNSIIKRSHGQYNMASFNTTVQEISNIVGEQLQVPVIEQGTTYGVYDFSISSEKFSKAFDFKFKETPYTIIEGLKQAYHPSSNTMLVSRTEYFNYGG